MLTKITLLPLPDAKVKRKIVVKVNNLQEIFLKRLKRLSGETKQEPETKGKEGLTYWLLDCLYRNMSTIYTTEEFWRLITLQVKQSTIVIL